MDFVASNVTDRLGNEFLKVTMTSSEGVVSKRTLRPEQFCELLGRAMKQELKYIEYKKDFYPEDTLCAMVADYDNYSIVWAEKPGKRCLVYREGHYIIPYPNLIFALTVRNGRVTSQRCFAEKRERDGKLYRYPFGNVETDGGGICMGSIQLDLKVPQDFSEEFYLGVTNDDYFAVGSKVKPQYTQSQLLEKLTKIDEFPDKWLIEHEGLSLNSLISQCKNNTNGYCY